MARWCTIRVISTLAGEPATNDIFDSVDTTWSRVSGGAEIASLIGDAIQNFDPQNPAASVPGLLLVRKQLSALPSDRRINAKLADLDRILMACLGLTVETTL